MKITLSYSFKITKYSYDVVYDGDNYTVEIYIDETDEMVEDNVFSERGDILGYEGSEGELRDILLTGVLKELH